MNRYWLITWTCYGTWLPGDARGFAGNIRDLDGRQVVHNVPGTPYDADIPPLEAYVRQHMTGPPVNLHEPEADAMIAQYQETARIRGLGLHAASVMVNHTQTVVGVPGDPEAAVDFGDAEEVGTRSSQEGSAAAAAPHVLDGQGFQAEAAGRCRIACGCYLRGEEAAQSAGRVVLSAMARALDQLIGSRGSPAVTRPLTGLGSPVGSPGEPPSRQRPIKPNRDRRFFGWSWQISSGAG